jgi:hypothetical protein
MKAGELRDALLAEHRDVRGHVDASRRVAERWTDGGASWIDVRDELARLADVLRSHNLHEERALRELVRSVDATTGTSREHVMDEAHISEHHVTLDALIRVCRAGDPGRERPHLEAFFSRLLAHMAWEEKSFLNATVLPDDDAPQE